jgi:hypothetical protein
MTIDLESTLDRRAHLKAQIALMEAEVDRINDTLEDYLTERGVKTDSIGRWQVTLSSTAGRKTLDPMKLVDLGVLPETIKAATKTGTGSTSVRVSSLDDEEPAADAPEPR